MTAAPLPVVPGLDRPEAIGRGGFGVVYAADEPAFSRRVAVSGEPYIVMEFRSGGSLADRMARGGPLPWSEVLDIGGLVAGALETAHRAGILHLCGRTACPPRSPRSSSG